MQSKVDKQCQLLELCSRTAAWEVRGQKLHCILGNVHGK